MNILSIQSRVSFGHVGNSAAMFPLQRLGAEVWGIDTVQFSNHPGYGSWRGTSRSADEIRDLVLGLDQLGVLGRVDAVLSGYLGSAGTGEAVLDAVCRVRASGPAALYCCDPVMGDNGTLYVSADLPEFFRERAMPQADILTPNQFELEQLVGHDCRDLPALRRAMLTLRAGMAANGPRVVLVTSLALADTPADAIDMVVASEQGMWRLRTSRLENSFSGAGDLTAAVFVFHMMRDGGAANALARTGASVWGVLERTASAGARELQLVAAQEEFVTPRLICHPVRIAND